MGRKYLYYCLLVVFLAGCGRSVDSNQDYDEKIKKAQKALEKNYNNPKAHSYLGTLYENRGLLSQAEKHYRIAIELDTQFIEAYRELGELYLHEKDVLGAIQILKKAIELSPRDTALQLLLASAYTQTKQYTDALSYYQKVIEIDPQNIQAQNHIGIINYELKEFKKAEEAFNRTIELDPVFADAYGNLGFIYDFNLNDKKKAIEYYEKCLQLKPEGENARLTQELLTKAKKEIEEIIPVKDVPLNSIENPPDKVVPQNNIENLPSSEDLLSEGTALMAQEQYEEAKEKFRNFLEKHPDDSEANLQWAILISKTNSPQDAIPVLSKALHKVKDPGRLWYELAQLYDLQNSPDSLRAYEEAVRLEPKDPRAESARQRIDDLRSKSSAALPKSSPPPITAAPAKIIIAKESTPIKPVQPPSTQSPKKVIVTAETVKQSLSHFNQAVNLQAKGLNQQAMAEYQKAVTQNPNNIKAHYNLGILYKWKGEFSKAKNEYLQVIRLDSRFPKAHYNLGIILTSEGRNDEAAFAFKKAIQLDPLYSDAYLGLGLIYSQKDRRQAALYYKKYLQLNPSGSASEKIRAWLKSARESK